MTPKMRQAVVTLIHKSKGLDPEKWKNYRPIAVTDIAYRILGTCIQLKLAPLLQHLTGESQPGFIPDRRIDDDIMAVTELAHYCNNRPGGDPAFLSSLTLQKPTTVSFLTKDP